MGRRELLSSAAKSAAGFALGRFGRGLKNRPLGRAPRVARDPAFAVSTTPDRRLAVREAIDKLGGISAFVNKGDYVLLKPNISWARTPEQAATTHPDTVAAVIELCKEAGARDVLVVDHIIEQDFESALDVTQVRDVAEALGARVVAAQTADLYTAIKIARGKCLQGDQALRDVLRADVFINMPTAKVHPETGVSLGMKNLMGLVWSPSGWHASGSIHQCIADFAGAVRPDLTILDASRVLLTNGPKGPGDVQDLHQVIAGTDQVAVDAYGATLFGLDPRKVAHIRKASESGVGEIDFDKINIDTKQEQLAAQEDVPLFAET